MADDNVHERINKLDKRVTTIEAKQPMLQELLERSISADEKLGETLHEMQTSMALMNQKMDAQSDAFEELKSDMAQANQKMEAKVESVHKEVNDIKDEGSFNIRTYIKANFPWIVVLIGGGIALLSKYFEF